MRDGRRAYRVVDLFEEELADYCGAPFAVAVNSGTNALFLALMWERDRYDRRVGLPKRTYVGVLQAALNADYRVTWWDKDWQSFSRQWYCLTGTGRVGDSARHLAKGMYRDVGGQIICLSFHSAKQLPLGRGGAILTDNEKAVEWFRAARMDGRPPGASFDRTIFPAWHMPMPPDVAARGLDILSRWNDAGYSPPALPVTEYPDLSLIYPPAKSSAGVELAHWRAPVIRRDRGPAISIPDETLS